GRTRDRAAGTGIAGGARWFTMRLHMPGSEHPRAWQTVQERPLMFGRMKDDLRRTLDEIRAEGLYKSERIITSPQGTSVGVAAPAGEGVSGTGAAGLATGMHKPDESTAAGREVLIMCANNYLGLAQHPAVREAAHKGLDEYGFGMASVRFICGT